MKIDIDLSEDGPVRVVQHLDVGAVTLLQGFNGIGKSSAIRLLLACTGTIPYNGQDRAWASLKQNVGQVIVRITELAGVESIEWHFDTRQWLNLNAPITTDWFSSIEIDSKPASLEEVRQVLTVHRLSGDTGVVDTLAEEIESLRDVVQGFRREVEEISLQSGSAGAALALLSRTLEVSGSVDATVVTQDQRALDLAAAELKRAEQHGTEVAQQLGLLNHASDTRDELNQLIEVGPELDDRIDTIRTDLKASQDRRDAVNAELEKIAVAASVGAEQRKELDAAEKLLSKNLDRLSDALVELSDNAAAVGVAPLSDSIAEATRQAEIQLEELARVRAKADVEPTLIRLVDDIRTPLVQAVAQELGNEYLVPADYSSKRSVGDLDAALRAYRGELASAPRSDQGASAEARFNALSVKLATLRRLPAMLDAVDRFQRLSAGHSKTVTELAKSTNLGAAADLDRLHDERDLLDTTILELFSERARLIKQRGLLGGGSDITVLQARLSAQLEFCGLETSDQIDDARTATEERAQNAQAALIAAKLGVDAAEGIVSTHRAELLGAATTIAVDEEFQWLRTGLPEIVPTEYGDAETALARVTEISSRAKKARGRLREFPNQLISIEQALASLAGELRGHAESATFMVAPLRGWLERRFAGYFTQDAIRTLLLSKEASDVRVDILKGSVHWLEGGLPQEKPLEAFSSGQQAFAYARARLALLDEEATGSQNRLICLDEFGAFMSADNRTDLDNFLLQRAKEHATDRTLLILPVRTDYREAANGSLGEERASLLEKANQLEIHGMLIEDVA